MIPEIGTDLNLDPLLMNSNDSNEYDHFARECPNDTPDRNTSDAEGSLLRMSDTDQAYPLDYTDGEDFDMDLNM